MPSDNETGGNQRTFAQCDALKIQGRLKLCSKSLIFEPIELRRPLIKFPLKLLTSKVENFRLKPSEQKQCSVEVSGFFTFTCSSYFEMKGNDKVGPYRQVDANSPHIGPEFFVDPDETGGKIQVLIALVHSELARVVSKIMNLKNVLDVIDREGPGAGEQLLPLNSASSEPRDKCTIRFCTHTSPPIKKHP